MTDKTAEPKYTYSASGVYHPPEDGLLADYRSYIDKLPLDDPPEIFGMHENANIAFNLKES